MQKIDPLNQKHDRNIFECGDTQINDYLKSQANQSAKKHYSQTHILTFDDSPSVIVGFYTLTSCILDAPLKSDLSIKYPHNLVGVKLARMGVDLKYQGKNYSELLVFDAIEKTSDIASNMGVQGLFVDAKSKSLVSYYEKYGFKSIADNPFNLWLPVNSCISLAMD